MLMELKTHPTLNYYDYLSRGKQHMKAEKELKGTVPPKDSMQLRNQCIRLQYTMSNCK